MKNIVAEIICIIICLLTLNSCVSSGTFIVDQSWDNYMPEPAKEYSGPALQGDTETNFTLWSWQVTSADLAQQYADEIKKYGFDGIELCVRWSDFEPRQGVFDWRYLDSVLDVFIKNGFNLSLSILFWSEDLEWKDALEYQETSDGQIYKYDDIRGSFLCLNSETNIEIVKNTVKYFAIHCASKYGNNITRWHIRTNCFANMEYAPLTDLDYSAPSMRAFVDFLSEKYSLEQFNIKYKTKYTAWEELLSVKKETLPQLCTYDWKLFKQDTIINFANICNDVLKIASENIPTVLQLGSFWDTPASYYRGVFDIYTISKKCNADIIQTSDSPAWPHDFSADLMTSMSDKLFAMEIDGAWRDESDFSGYVDQAATIGASKIHYLNTVNWELEDIQAYGEKYISKFTSGFNSAEERADADETDVILVNTLDFLLRQPPQDLYDLYYYAYKNMSGKNARKVRFISDTQIIENPDILNGIKKIHLGQLDEVIYIQDEVGEILANSNVRLIDDRNDQPSFVDQYGEPLKENIQVKLRQKIKNS